MGKEFLHAWLEDQHVGVFTRVFDEVTFEYDKDFTHPISLSLPVGGGWTREAPKRFLENLLPDDLRLRQIMASHVGAKTSDTFDLLDNTDVAGGFVFSRNDVVPSSVPDRPRLATDDEIAARISKLRSSADAWWGYKDGVRFSLAGTQSKFALTRQFGHWYWASTQYPSTHIFKPASGLYCHVEQIETVSMRLSALCGIPTPECGIVSFENEEVYVVERFDRVSTTSGKVIRVHAEDFAQSLGIPPERKYNVTVRQILSLLHSVDETDELSYEWIRRLALNVSISNVDAHAKNYSVILRPTGVTLSPMYDVITTTFWPSVSRKLPMAIGGVSGAKQLTPHHWRRLAARNNLDADRVETIARQTAWLVLENADKAYEDLPANLASRLKHELEQANLRIEPLAP